MFSSVAWSCIATIIVLASLSRICNQTSHISILVSLNLNLVETQLLFPLQKGPHYVDNPLIHVQQLCVVQWSRIDRANVVEDSLLPLWLIDRKIGCSLKFADRLRRFCALADESNNLFIQLINLLSPIGDIHAIA